VGRTAAMEPAASHCGQMSSVTRLTRPARAHTARRGYAGDGTLTLQVMFDPVKHGVPAGNASAPPPSLRVVDTRGLSAPDAAFSVTYNGWSNDAMLGRVPVNLMQLPVAAPAGVGLVVRQDGGKGRGST
jgi:hypothetical protein